MGAYNLPEFSNELDSRLKNSICPFCNGTFNWFNRNFDKDGFEYICTSCNPKVVIGISRSLMKSDCFEHLWNNYFVRESLRGEIIEYNKPYFMITTDDVTKLIS